MILNVVTILAWFGIPAFLLTRAEQTSRGDGSGRLGFVVLIAMGVVALVLLIASYVLARRAPFSRTFVNVVVQLTFAATIPLFVIYPAVSVFAFLPLPALIWSGCTLLSGSAHRQS